MDKWWVVSDELDRADAIVVLGGGLDVRPAAAADLYKRGVSDQILVANAYGRYANLNREELLKHGVPAAAITEFDYRLSSTYGEARAILEWAKTSDAKNLII